MVWWWWRGWAARSEATGTVRTVLRWRHGNAGSDKTVVIRRFGFRIMPVDCVTFLSYTYTFYQQLHPDVLILTRGRPSRPKQKRCVATWQWSGGGGGVGGPERSDGHAACGGGWGPAIDIFRHRADMQYTETTKRKFCTPVEWS